MIVRAARGAMKLVEIAAYADRRRRGKQAGEKRPPARTPGAGQRFRPGCSGQKRMCAVSQLARSRLQVFNHA